MTPEAFENLAELVPDGLVLLSGDGRILALNRVAASLFPDKDASYIGQSLHHLADCGANGISDLLKLCRRTNGEVVGGFRLVGTDSPTRFFVRLLTRADTRGDCRLLLRIPDQSEAVNRFTVLNQKIVELGREITRRQAAETELLEQRDLATFGRDIGIALAERSESTAMLHRCAELIVEHLGGAFARIWTLAPKSNELVLRASAGMYTHLDGDHSRIRVGQYKIGMIAEQQTPHLTNAVIGDSRVHNQEWAERTKMVAFAGYPLIVDGRTVGVMAMFAREQLSENRLAAMASVANSIALGLERKRIEAQFKRTARILKLADQRKDEFLAMLAHELRNPLAPIRFGLELMRLESEDNETLALMDDQVRHLSRLVDDLMDVSRIMRGKIELRTEAVQLEDVIDHAVRTVRPAIEGHQHALTVTKSDAPLWLNADRVRLGQIVTNLLGNAAKYTPDGGRVHIESRIDGDSASLIVRDNGVGIDSEFLPDVFDLFAQAEHGLARSEGGLGLGLTLVQRLVGLHNGTIEVRSEGLGTGSEFVVRLPLMDAPPVFADNPDSVESDASPACRILVVDDSIGSAKILRRLLIKLGIEQIELAHDGPSAIDAAEKFQPDIIFLDIGLPGLTGFEVCQQLRASSQFQSTKLIALTGYGTAEDRRKSREVGFDHHLIKPAGLAELKQAIS